MKKSLGLTKIKPKKPISFNVRMGFNNMTTWCKNNPGTKKYSCEWCGIYEASRPRCSECWEGE